ncbi:hypothetical protein AEAC466_12610 [Asticcacaulis sp. AC466]|uniref:hypothetical protein n=1 Tax=Asticcacaulis sp. AC466 TaxID=1282362 RepID=UPI0003C3BF66|nr:hypothetical protein [Asticcacaulis sp. AC466]ESQ83511.1 hypothetical protein AEAC466_12610 [Asticcacaulis sp. AC466]
MGKVFAVQTGIQTWRIYIESKAYQKPIVCMGGTVIKQKEADFSPLRIVADAMLLGKRIAAPEYIGEIGSLRR